MFVELVAVIDRKMAADSPPEPKSGILMTALKRQEHGRASVQREPRGVQLSFAVDLGEEIVEGLSRALYR